MPSILLAFILINIIMDINETTRLKLKSDLKIVTSELVDLLESLTDEQINIIPFSGSWTAGKLGDHLLKSYTLVETLNGTVIPTKRNADEKVNGIKESFLDFNTKMKSPDFILPVETPINKHDLIVSLQQKIKEIEIAIKNQDLTLTCLDFCVPGAGEFTRFEWLSFMLYHTQRHIHQLKNIISYLDKPEHLQDI